MAPGRRTTPPARSRLQSARASTLLRASWEATARLAAGSAGEDAAGPVPDPARHWLAGGPGAFVTRAPLTETADATICSAASPAAARMALVLLPSPCPMTTPAAVCR